MGKVISLKRLSEPGDLSSSNVLLSFVEHSDEFYTSIATQHYDEC